MKKSDIELQGQWIANNLTAKNKALLSESEITVESARAVLIEIQMTAIVADRTKALCNAIDSGACLASKYPKVRTVAQRREIAKAAIAHL